MDFKWQHIQDIWLPLYWMPSRYFMCADYEFTPDGQVDHMWNLSDGGPPDGIPRRLQYVANLAWVIFILTSW